MLYNIFTFLLCVYTAGLDIASIFMCKGIKYDGTDEYLPKLLLPAFIVGVYSILVGCLVGGLSCYHADLAITNSTTQETMKGKYNQWDGNPYDLGTCSCANAKYFWNK